MNHVVAISEMRWPRQIRPGDERFVDAALTLHADGGPVWIRFLFDRSISVVGAHRIDHNLFKFPRSTEPVRYGLKYIGLDTASVNTRSDVAIALSRYRWRRRRVGLAALLIGVAMLPPLILACRWSVCAVQLTVGEAVVMSLPVVAVFAVVGGWKRILSVVHVLLTKEVYWEECIGTVGNDAAYIELVDEISDPGVAVGMARTLGGSRVRPMPLHALD